MPNTAKSLGKRVIGRGGGTGCRAGAISVSQVLVFSAWPLSLLPGVTWSHLSRKAVYCLAQASVHLVSLRGIFMQSLLFSSFLMINEQAALRVSNVTPESKEMMQLNFFLFFFGLSLPPGKNIGVGCHAPLQGIFLTQGLDLVSYVFCIGRQVLYHQCHLGSP